MEPPKPQSCLRPGVALAIPEHRRDLEIKNRQNSIPRRTSAPPDQEDRMTRPIILPPGDQTGIALSSVSFRILRRLGCQWCSDVPTGQTPFTILGSEKFRFTRSAQAKGPVALISGHPSHPILANGDGWRGMGHAIGQIMSTSVPSKSHLCAAQRQAARGGN